ncbi:MAG: HYR domain-containing protein, partial [Phaeodactylibacter sp.]|nr:HYR domain-containing protein [Phaeodactylibacter sp.]
MKKTALFLTLLFCSVLTQVHAQRIFRHNADDQPGTLGHGLLHEQQTERPAAGNGGQRAVDIAFTNCPTNITVNAEAGTCAATVTYPEPTTDAPCEPLAGPELNLPTPYNTNNGQRGIMFDVMAANTITIERFDANLYSGTTADYEIYYKAGTFVGFENDGSAWTKIGPTVTITSLGNNVPTPIPIDVDIAIPAGQRYAFYITNTFGGGTSYTDGAAVGNFLAGDANLSVYEGVGKSYPFGLTFTVRKFNGTIYYREGGCAPTFTQTMGLGSGASFPVGTTTETYVADDGMGNTATCSFSVTVQDNQAPTAMCQNATVQLNAGGSASVTAAQVNNSSSDNCGVASLSVSPNTFSCANVGPNAVTLTVTDVNGNSASCSATVTVQDNTAPTAS